MFKQKYNLIIAVQDDDVSWTGQHGEVDKHSFQMPLDQLLDSQDTLLQLPKWLKGKQKPLCVIPDHWFSSASYPFQSKKPSLIEPFLERKLAAASPGQEAIQHFYNYRHVGDDKDQELEVLFFQEDKSYQLYTALQNLNHIPQQITSPAFLWEERLADVDDDFAQQGTLLVHHAPHECHLYFYYKGNYQFSRSVVLVGTDSDLDTLAFEINQSLYMFSQKAKNELDRIYMLCEVPQYREKLGEALGREIIDLRSVAQQGTETITAPGMETPCGLLQELHIDSSASFFGVMHRQVKQAMAWKPVQWAGIFIGLFLFITLLYEQYILNNMYNQTITEYQAVQEEIIQDTAAVELTEYTATLDQVLEMGHRSELAANVHRVSAAFPTGTQLKKLDFKMELPPTLKVTCMVQASTANELQVALSRLIAQLAKQYHTARPLTLNDIDIHLNQPLGGQEPISYQIEFQLELQ